MCLGRSTIMGLHPSGMELHGRTIFWLQTAINALLSNTSVLVDNVAPLIETKLQHIKFIDYIKHDCIILIIKVNVD
jgi:hypothetical protein